MTLIHISRSLEAKAGAKALVADLVKELTRWKGIALGDSMGQKTVREARFYQGRADAYNYLVDYLGRLAIEAQPTAPPATSTEVIAEEMFEVLALYNAAVARAVGDRKWTLLTEARVELDAWFERHGVKLRSMHEDRDEVAENEAKNLARMAGDMDA